MGPQNAVKIIEERMQVRVPIKAGPRTIGVAFVEKSEAMSPTLLRPYLSTLDPVDSEGVPQLEAVTVSGPFSVTGPGDTPSRRRIFSCRPSAARAPASSGSNGASSLRAGNDTACAKQILRRSRASRIVAPSATPTRPAARLLRDGPPEEELRRRDPARRRAHALGSQFVFRAEHDPADLTPGTAFRVNDLELASRLSFFLWSSIPDEPLLALASRGKLRDPAVLEQQVRRMMLDRRAQALVSNFAGQWLYLRNLKNVVPSKDQFPEFDDNLRQAFQRETELLVESVMHEDRSVLDLLTADYTFVNERLAKHYGIPNVYGSQFRRVPVASDARRGLLGHGSILTVTSQANRTSPVLRGKWMLDNLLGSPPPPPPPDVPPLKDNAERERPLTMREQMEEHRANAACASCHKLMDPLGFALENFDAIGAWRTTDARSPIDPSSQLADGTKVDGPVALRQTLLRHPDAFVGTMTEKLLTYALGRGLEPYDMPAIRAIVRNANHDNYRFSSIVLGVVNSTPFQMKSASGWAPSFEAGRSRARRTADRD
jgi:hypothetical protein